MNSIISEGFWAPNLYITEGYGRWRVFEGTAKRTPEIGIPIEKEMRFDLRNPIEVDMQTDFEVFNPVEKNKGLAFPIYSPLLRVNNYFYDMDLAVLINKQMSLPIEQRMSYDKLIRILKAI